MSEFSLRDRESWGLTGTCIRSLPSNKAEERNLEGWKKDPETFFRVQTHGWNGKRENKKEKKRKREKEGRGKPGTDHVMKCIIRWAALILKLSIHITMLQ